MLRRLNNVCGCNGDLLEALLLPDLQHRQQLEAVLRALQLPKPDMPPATPIKAVAAEHDCGPAAVAGATALLGALQQQQKDSAEAAVGGTDTWVSGPGGLAACLSSGGLLQQEYKAGLGALVSEPYASSCVQARPVSNHSAGGAAATSSGTVNGADAAKSAASAGLHTVGSTLTVVGGDQFWGAGVIA